MIDNKKSIKYPKIIGKRYLLTYIEELNYGMYGAMGDKMPLSFSEIDSYMRVTNTELNHWDALALIELSTVYIYQTQKKDVSEQPPYMEVSEIEYIKQTAISSSSIAKAFGVVLKK